MAPTIAFEFAHADVMAFRQFFVHTSPFGKRQIRIWQATLCGIGLVLIGQLLFVARQRGELQTADVVILTVGAAYLAYALFLFPRSFRRHWMKRMDKFDRHHSQEAQFGACSCTLHEDTLEYQTPISATRYRVDKLHKLTVYDAHLFIFVDGQTAVIIPKARVMAGDVAGFVAELQRRMVTATGTAVAG